MPGTDPAASPTISFFPEPVPASPPPGTGQDLGQHQAESGPDKRRRLLGSGWPMRSCLELWALPRTVPEARRHTVRVLREWGLEELSGTAELLISEILTNAILVSARPPGGPPGLAPDGATSTLLYWLAADGNQALIQVWDRSERKPRPQQPGSAAENGRGLMLVAALSAEWGTYALNGWAGKVVWALISEAT